MSDYHYIAVRKQVKAPALVKRLARLVAKQTGQPHAIKRCDAVALALQEAIERRTPPKQQ